MSTRLELDGLLALLPLPMTRDYNINESELRKVVDWCVEKGAQGLVATGSVGEFIHLSITERYRVMDIVLDQGRKHSGVSVMAMTSGAATLETIEHTRYANEIGYDAAMIVAPFYWKVTEEECYRHYEMITEAVDIPVIVYHNPILSKFFVTPEFAERLTKISGLIGIKEVGTDMTYLQKLFEKVGDKWKIIQTFRGFLYALLQGASLGMPNVFALPACVRIKELFQQGEISAAIKIQWALTGIFEKGLEESTGAMGRIKTAASLVSGFDFGPPRPPYLEPGPEAKKMLKASCDNLALVIESTKQ